MIKRRRKKPLKEDSRELGFGNKLADASTRLINKDGSFNVIREGLPFGERYLDLYHVFITMSWIRFFLVIIGGYFMINVLFATLYMLMGVDAIQGMQKGDTVFTFWEAFFFSTQTFTTVGYGRLAPVSWLANFTASIESMLGLLTFAVATGLLYGRFARPQARIIYSENALIAPYKDRTGVMFRIANARSSQLIEVEADVILSMVDRETSRRQYFNLKLELDRINMLSLNWTIVHEINEDSPLYGMTAVDFAESDAQMLIFMKAFDDTFSQVVYHRSSYYHTELVWGGKFKPMFSTLDNSTQTRLKLDKISEYEQVALPEVVVEDEL